MARVDPFEIPGQLSVTAHAIQQARQRFNDPELDKLSDIEVGALIAEQVRAAIAAGQVYDSKPRPFRLYGDPGTGVTPWQRFVLHHLRGSNRGWIVALDRLPDAAVLTSLVAQPKIAKR